MQGLDAAVKSDFQALRDAYFHRLTGCTIAVVVGVILEEVEYFLSWPSVRRFVPLQILLPTHRFDLWVAKITKLGWALIVLGVAGEGLYEARVSHADGWLQDFGNIVVASVQREAADAVGEAGRAIERAGEANREAGEARKEAERLHRENLLLQADVLKLRERMADRHLTPKQQSAIANRLCPQFGGLNITSGLYCADGEMNASAADIDGALPLLCPNNRIGWAVSISPVQTTEGFSGLRISWTRELVFGATYLPPHYSKH